MVVPTVEQEAARDLVRAREDGRGRSDAGPASALEAAAAARDRVLRRAGVDRGARRLAAAAAFRSWPATRLAFESDYETVLRSRRAGTGWTRRSLEMAADSEFTPVVRRLGCLRGISHLDRVRAGGRDRRLGPVHRRHHRRLPGAGALASTPRAPSRVQGSITKTGNSHVRRLLVEAAWHHRGPLRRRQDHARPLGAGPGRPPAPAATRATTGCTSAGSGSPSARSGPSIANVAIARELAGWCWSLAVMDD